MLQVCGHIKHVVVLVALHSCHHFICCPCSHTLTFSPACEFLADFVDSHAAKTGLLMCCECESNEITSEEYKKCSNHESLLAQLRSYWGGRNITH